MIYGHCVDSPSHCTNSTAINLWTLTKYEKMEKEKRKKIFAETMAENISNLLTNNSLDEHPGCSMKSK